MKLFALIKLLEELGWALGSTVHLTLPLAEVPEELLLAAPATALPALPRGQEQDRRLPTGDGRALHLHLLEDGRARVHLDGIDPTAGWRASLLHLSADTLIPRLAFLLALPGLAFGFAGAAFGAALGVAFGAGLDRSAVHLELDPEGRLKGVTP